LYAGDDTLIAEGTNTSAARPGGDAAGASMVFVMRLVLALTAILTLFVAPGDLGNRYGATTVLSALIFGGYLLHSLTLLVARRHRTPFWHGKAVYWIDLGWYALMVYCTGGSNSFFFPFFFFVILTASFQWGFDEGARITLGATFAWRWPPGWPTTTSTTATCCCAPPSCWRSAT
jgi:hypothetical protein